MSFVPPGGVAGVSQQTVAGRAAMGMLRAKGNGKRRTRAAKSNGKRKTKRKASRANGRKLKFGSPAWRKKFMKKK